MDLRNTYHSFDLNEYRRQLIDILVNEDYVIFLDTNILSSMFKLYKDARTDFYKWVNANRERIKIPNWVLNEYLKYAVNTEKLKEFYPINFSRIYKDLENQINYLKLLIDDTKAKEAGYDNKLKLINELQGTSNFLSNIHKKFRINNEINDIRKEIDENLLNLVLKQQIGLSADLLAEFNTRLENCMPPGYHEFKKENVIGDFIIWKEILEHVRQGEKKKAIFLTNDGKADWLYVCEKIIYNGKEIPNNTSKHKIDIKLPVKLADPRLVNEFYFTVNSSDFYICDLSFFCNVLSSKNPGEYPALESVYQTGSGGEDEAITDFAAEEIKDFNKDEECKNTQNTTDNLISIQEKLGVEEYAIKDEMMIPNITAELNEIITGFKSYTWMKQSEALYKLFKLDKTNLTPSEYFIIGRNLYQTACGNEWETLKFIKSNEFKNISEREENIDKVISGMLFEAYFDKQALPRENIKNTKIEIIFMYRKSHDRSFKLIGNILKEKNVKLMYYPGDETEFNITPCGNLEKPDGYFIDIYLINSMKINDTEILQEKVTEEDKWSDFKYWDLRRSFSSIAEMSSVFANQLIIPANMINFHKPNNYTGGSLEIDKRLKIVI